MVKGCSCGSRLFKQAREIDAPIKEKQESKSDKIETENDDIAIMIQEKGVYSVNLKTLTSRESSMEPLFVQDSTGKINVLLNPDT